jgi:glucose/arabinose dehydrogenase
MIPCRTSLVICGVLAWGSAAVGDVPVEPVVSGLRNPSAVAYGFEGRLYVSELGEPGRDGDGRIVVVENGRPQPFATGLDDPRGLVFFKEGLFVVDRKRIVRIDATGTAADVQTPGSFPREPVCLHDIAVDPQHEVFAVSDPGGGRVYRVPLKGGIETIADATTIPGLRQPAGLAFDGHACVLVADRGTGDIHRVKLADRSSRRIAAGLDGVHSLVWDHHGRLFVTSATTGEVFGIPQPAARAVPLAVRLQAAGDGCLRRDAAALLVPRTAAGMVVSLPAVIPGREVDERPLDVQLQPAFPKLTWTGWDDGSDSGVATPLRPIVLTHFGDGSGRIVVASQRGMVHAFAKDAEATSLLLDISTRLRYSDKQNEEGLLGLAFHPRFKENGELFVYYTDAGAKLKNVVSRFRMKPTGPPAADPDSEERLITFDRPFWNHNAGTLAFGPDGFLYIVVGDGGAGGDPYGNAQNLGTHLGKVLRIDVDRKADGRPYAIPADNPFVGRHDAKPEIWCSGLRNPWRMAFDRRTGRLWAADVGQNLYEEIDILEKGRNYGWNPRESLHPFGARGADLATGFADPIWEYDHDLGKSITGGVVYRGTAVPAIDGHYLYADYTSSALWALKYDEPAGRVTANRPLPKTDFAVLSFGEDEAGEVYLLGNGPAAPAIVRIAPPTRTAAAGPITAPR